jgi:hypothetical protein
LLGVGEPTINGNANTNHKERVLTHNADYGDDQSEDKGQI